MEENKQRKPVMIIEGSSSEEEEEQVDQSANKKRKKIRSGENSRKRADSRMCHQCRRNDKDRVVCCSRCNAKRFCVHCITRWYPGMPEDSFLEACPVCRNICNCIECLRLNGRAKHLMNVEVKFTDEEKLDYSKYIVRALLPALEQISLEQMIEKQIEYQIQAFPNSDAIVHKAEYEKDKRIYCNNCSAFIVDFHRSCSSCSYKLCLTCCKELRNGNLPADASEVRMQYIDNGEGCSTTSAKNGTSIGTIEVETRDQTEVAMASNWKPTENGAIPCPPKDMGGCSEGILSLRCLFSENWILELLLKAKEIAQKCNLKEIRIDPKLHYSRSKSKVESNTSDGKLCKAAARDNSEDNYVYCPAAVDAQHANSRRFRLSLSEGEPVIVTDVHKNAVGLSWEPMVMWRACRQTKKSTEVLNCLNWCKVEMNIHQFFKGYMEGRFDSYGRPQLLQLPPLGLFDERLLRHGAEFSRCLPFKEYTHPQYGYFNLALRLPDNCAKPDLGPKAYIAYGFPKELGRGDSVTKLHYAVTDTVHVLMQTQAVVPGVEKFLAVEKLKQIDNAQDQREFVADANRRHESIKDYISNVKGKFVLKGMNISQEKQKCGGLKVQNRSKSVCETNEDGEEYQSREDSSSLLGLDKPPGFEEANGSALWDVFRRQDVPKLEEFLRKHFREFRDIYGSPLTQVVHPIFDETFYLSTEHKWSLKKEYGIEPWTFVQKLGEAVFVPAGCPYQVRNLKSCINVAVDFISPENVNECIRLTEELRTLPKNHVAREDKLGPFVNVLQVLQNGIHFDNWVKKIIVHAMSRAVDRLEKTLLNSEAGTATGLSVSSSIRKSINSMPGPIMPRSCSFLEDLSSSKTVKREEYVALSGNEVNLHPPLPVFSANKAQESTSVPSQELKQFINIEDVESTFHAVQSFLKTLPGQYPSQQSGLQSSSTSSAQTLAKLTFDCSIKLPLEALAHDPISETEMHGAIAALNENPSSMFSDEQATQLVKLKYEFPVMAKKWRDLAGAESKYQEFLTNFEEDRKKLDEWIKSEERLKAAYQKKEEQARELEEILEAIRTRQKEIMDERQEGSREAQKFMLLAEEKAGKIESTSNELATTKIQMESLRKNWSNFQSKFP